jgi:hypothetical protein
VAVVPTDTPGVVTQRTVTTVADTVPLKPASGFNRNSNFPWLSTSELLSVTDAVAVHIGIREATTAEAGCRLQSVGRAAIAGIAKQVTVAVQLIGIRHPGAVVDHVRHTIKIKVRATSSAQCFQCRVGGIPCEWIFFGDQPYAGVQEGRCPMDLVVQGHGL